MTDNLIICYISYSIDKKLKQKFYKNKYDKNSFSRTNFQIILLFLFKLEQK